MAAGPARAMALAALRSDEIPGDWLWPETTTAYRLRLRHRGFRAVPEWIDAVGPHAADVASLDFSLNRIAIAPSGPILSPYAALRHLDLSGNLLTDVVFDGLPHLADLNLRRNLIRTMAPLRLPALLRLDLGVNELHDLPALYLPNLIALDVSGNSLESLMAIRARGLPVLRHLNADQNQIAEIYPIATLSQIATLSLACNRLSSLNDLVDALRQMQSSSLRVLNFWGNAVDADLAYRMMIADAVPGVELLDAKPLRPFLKQRLALVKQNDDVEATLKQTTAMFGEKIEREQHRLNRYLDSLKQLEHRAETAFDEYRDAMENELQTTIRFIQMKRNEGRRPRKGGDVVEADRVQIPFYGDPTTTTTTTTAGRSDPASSVGMWTWAFPPQMERRQPSHFEGNPVHISTTTEARKRRGAPEGG